MNTETDFPDWISPMLVKELRQGMRARVFLISFLALQFGMIFLSIIGLLNPADAGTGGVTFFFWAIISVPLIMVMPLSGLRSIAGEKKENTLELIFLSRLGARRIVLGKWLAIVAQTALLVSAVLPYAVLRYYFGGVDLVGGLEMMGWLLLGSAVLTGMTVGFSPAAGRFGAALIPVGFILGLQFLAIVSANSFFGSGFTGFGVKDVWAVLCLVAVFLFFMLEVGAGRIAPPAENHSTSKRLAALLTVILCTGSSTLLPGSSWPWIFGAFILIPVGIGAVCEPIPEASSVYGPFVRRGFLGRMLGLLFYPGWPSGVLFSLAMLALLFLLPHGPFAPWVRSLPPGVHIGGATSMSISGLKWWFPQAEILVCAITGGLLLPAAFLHFFRVRFVKPLVFYVLFQAACALLVVLVSSLSDVHHGSSGVVLVAWIPFCGLLIYSSMFSWDEPLVMFALYGSAAVTLVSMLVLFILILLRWKTISALQKAAAVPHVPASAEPA